MVRITKRDFDRISNEIPIDEIRAKIHEWNALRGFTLHEFFIKKRKNILLSRLYNAFTEAPENTQGIIYTEMTRIISQKINSSNSIKFYAENLDGSKIIIGYLDALGVSWNSYKSFSNYNSGQLQSEGIESKDINVESSLTKILQVDALGDYKKPFGIIGKNWEIEETDISKYGFSNGGITAKIINSIKGHNKVLKLSKGANLSSISLPLGTLDKLDYEIFIFVDTINTQLQFGGYYYIDPENYGNINKIVIDPNGNISYTDETPLGNGSYGTNYSISLGKWNHFRIEWRKGLYFIVFLNGNEIIKITESSLGLNDNSIEQFDIDLEDATIYVDAIAFNTHTKNYGYNKYSNMSDGVGIFKGVHADRAIIKQVRTKIADVNSSGNFKKKSKFIIALHRLQIFVPTFTNKIFYDVKIDMMGHWKKNNIDVSEIFAKSAWKHRAKGWISFTGHHQYDYPEDWGNFMAVVRIRD